MKTILTVLFLSLTTMAHADYLNRFAHYQTSSRVGQGAELVIGSTEIRVTAFDQALGRYSVQTTHRSVGLPDETSVQSFLASEFQKQDDGELFKNCQVNYGRPGLSVTVQGISYPSCLIQSSNSEMNVGQVPFSVLKSVSRSGQNTFTTQLIDFHP